MATVVLLGTCDTKLQEILYLRSEILAHGVDVLLLDVGRSGADSAEGGEAITLTQPTLLARYADPGIPAAARPDPSSLPRSDFVRLMGACAARAVRDLHSQGRIHGIVSAGGSGGTALAARVMRDEALPLGFPKLMVSTVASGDTGPLVGEVDLAMMYPVVDVAGLNGLLREVLSNAGAMIAGAAAAYRARTERARAMAAGAPASSGWTAGGPGAKKKRVGITMFGVTTPGADAVRRHLEARYPVETYVFHATGHGGRAMERLVREGRLDAILDLTTTEICDLVAGGVMSAGPERLDAAIAASIPTIVSLGATDMTNFGPRDTVPERYRGRRLHEHNPAVTLMRTDEAEARRIAEFICGKLSRASRKDLVQVWIPKGGVSIISTPGGPFDDAKADEVLFETLKGGLKGSGIVVVEDERDVNDEGFARDIADALAMMMGLKGRDSA